MISMKKRDLSRAFNLPSLRISLGLLFLISAIINAVFAFTNPDPYKNWQNTAKLEIYRSFLHDASWNMMTMIILSFALYLLITACFFFAGVKYPWAGHVGDWMALAFTIFNFPMGEWALANIPHALLYVWLIVLYIKDRNRQRSAVYKGGAYSSK